MASPSSAISLSGKLNEFSLPVLRRESMAGRYRPVPERGRGKPCLSAAERRWSLIVREYFANDQRLSTDDFEEFKECLLLISW